MSKRKDIMDGRKAANLLRNFGLIYTCNCGWVDLGHLNPTSNRTEIGAGNLWNNIKNSGKTDQHNTFSDGSIGYRLTYRQDHAGYPFKPGREGTFLIKHGLTVEQKKRVALAVYIGVTHMFEDFQLLIQGISLNLLTNSGYSQEDLSSNLIGFYIGINELNRMAVLKQCHPVSDQSAYAIWDRDGAVGASKNKNIKWIPKLARNIMISTSLQCSVECGNQPKRFPAVLTRIKPAKLGVWHIKL